MNYPHNGATWQTNLTTSETVKISGRTEHDIYQGCVGRVIGLIDGRVILLLSADRVRSFCPHDLTRLTPEPHITLIEGTPRAIAKPLTRRPPDSGALRRRRR